MVTSYKDTWLTLLSCIFKTQQSLDLEIKNNYPIVSFIWDSQWMRYLYTHDKTLLKHKTRTILRENFSGKCGKQKLLMPKLTKCVSIHERYLLKLYSRATFFGSFQRNYSLEYLYAASCNSFNKTKAYHTKKYALGNTKNDFEKKLTTQLKGVYVCVHVFGCHMDCFSVFSIFIPKSVLKLNPEQWDCYYVY